MPTPPAPLPLLLTPLLHCKWCNVHIHATTCLINASCICGPHAVQVFFYKRAQIFVGDLYGAFGGQGLGQLHDIDQITMFAGALLGLRVYWAG
jgi:hypothetical protein